MRIAYCTNVRLPSERAHGHQVAQVCDALTRLGHMVRIYCPYRRNVITEDYWTYFRANRRVEVRYIGTVDFIQNPFLPGPFKLWAMNRALRTALPPLLDGERFDLLYTRSPALLRSLLATGIPTVLELHSLPRRGRRHFVRLASQCALVAALTTPMRDALVAWGVPAERVIAEGDAVDLRRFEDLPSREDARGEFDLSTDRPVAGYVGRLKTLGMEKGVAHLLEAIARLRADAKPWHGLIVGGPQRDRREYEAMAAKLGLTAEDVTFTGEQPATRVPTALAACDVLAMPFPDLPHYRFHMSPLKMFEYMAAGRPLLSSDLPTVRDVLNESNAVFCTPGDVGSLADALRWIVDHPQQAQARATQALEDVQEHTWERRMGRILTSIKGSV